MKKILWMMFITASIIAGGDYGNKSDCTILRQLLSWAQNQQSSRKKQEISELMGYYNQLISAIASTQSGLFPCDRPETDVDRIVCMSTRRITKDLLHEIKTIQDKNPHSDNHVIRCQFHKIVQAWKSVSSEDLSE